MTARTATFAAMLAGMAAGVLVTGMMALSLASSHETVCAVPVASVSAAEQH